MYCFLVTMNIIMLLIIQYYDLYGNIIDKDGLVDYCQIERSVNNIPISVIEKVALRYLNTSNGSKSPIVDPFEYANEYYAGPFVAHDYVNEWEGKVAFFIMDTAEPYGYYNHCGPTAITNMVLSYAKKYPGKVSLPSDLSVFLTTAQIGINYNYYTNINNDYGGTNYEKAGIYAQKVFNHYSINANVSSKLPSTYSNIKSNLGNGSLLLVNLVNHSTYGNHFVMGFACNRMVSQSTGYYLSFIKVSDGWNTSARYVTVASADNGEEHSGFYAASF